MGRSPPPRRLLHPRQNRRRSLRWSPSPIPDVLLSRSNEVSVAGKRNFQGRDKEAETALEIQGRRCRDKISLGNSANSGLIAGFREISVRTRMRGGAGRTRTPNQAVMKQVALRTIRDKISASKGKGLWVGAIGAKSPSMSRGGPGTAALLSRGAKNPDGSNHQPGLGWTRR
jgi:hypothetical protein